ncbi:MAG TPA: ABC transporter permease [Candidatus Angelobacter sp.]|nr:ABC transporter permease [Candidatus Angelobacter sp.]
METLLQDIRYGIRILLKNPGFTAVAILTLALGIGANTAIFSVVNTVLLRSLPYRNPDRLVKIVTSNRAIGTRDIGLSVPELDDLKSKSDIFEDLSVTWPANANVTGSEHPDRLEMLGVSPNYFSMLGVNAQIGRVFGPQDQTEGFAESVVISDSAWRRSFGKDPNILGRKLQLDNDPYTVVGVLEPGFRHPGKTVATDVDVWATAGFHANPFPKPARNLRILPGAIGRLKSDLSVAQAQAKMDAFVTALRHEYPNDYPARTQWSIELEPLQESLVGNVKPMLLLLMGSVILIMLLASVNIANLLLARASGRQREMAVRQAMGASGSRMFRQMLTESIVLSLIAGVAGVLTAVVALQFLRFVPAKIPRLHEVSVDWAVMAFALFISLLTGIAFGLAPAFHSTKTDIISAIREGAQGSGYGTKTNRLRRALIVSELALAVTLMVGAGLLLRTFWELLRQDPGFNSSGVVASSIWLPVPNNPDLDPYAKPGAQGLFVREVLRRLGALPGVNAVALTTDLPTTASAFRLILNIEDHPIQSAQDQACELTSVSPDYFKVMQTPLLSGRFFKEDDDATRERVALVDETTARRYWSNQDVLGKRIRFGRAPTAPWLSIVGVVSNMKTDGLDARKTVPHIYVPLNQAPQVRSMIAVLQTSLPVSGLEPQIRHEVQSVDPNLPIFHVRTMTEIIGASLSPHRFSAELVGVFAALALLLASIGIYGLLAYMVGQRSQEIGIRMALGAHPSHIRRMVLNQGAVLAGIGVLVGLVCAGLVAPLMSSQLFGIHAIDPLVFLTVPLVLIIVAVAASYIPARRASMVDPLVTLRR